jgi:hypothetical protein
VGQTTWFKPYYGYLDATAWESSACFAGPSPRPRSLLEFDQSSAPSPTMDVKLHIRVLSSQFNYARAREPLHGFNSTPNQSKRLRSTREYDSYTSLLAGDVTCMPLPTNPNRTHRGQRVYITGCTPFVRHVFPLFPKCSTPHLHKSFPEFLCINNRKGSTSPHFLTQQSW